MTTSSTTVNPSLRKIATNNRQEDKIALEKWNQELLDWLNGDGGQAVTKSVEALTNGMSSIFTQLSSLVQSEMEIETAAIEKRYEREVSMAEDNKYKTKQLEKQKQKEVAKVKDEANRKLLAMPVARPLIEGQPIFNLVETIARLNERLNEPFVTVNTVTGDLGVKQAQDDNGRLIKNKSPKNKRKYRKKHYLCGVKR